MNSLVMLDHCLVKLILVDILLELANFASAALAHAQRLELAV